MFGIDQLLKIALTPDNIKATNEALRKDLAAIELQPGEIGAMMAVTCGEDAPMIQHITLKSIPDPENPDRQIIAYGRSLGSKALLEFIQVMMGAKLG